MKPAPFEYVAPVTLAAALELLRDGEEVRPLAGGQSLVPMLALRLARPALLVDLNRIPGLAGITVTPPGIRIGAMTRQADALASPEVAAHAPLLAQALWHVGHPPTRARGTVGGSLAHADPAAELPVALAALEATVVTASAAGERRIPARDFVLGAFETALGPGEIVVAVEVARETGGTSFHELAARKGDFAIVSAAARLTLAADGTCRSCALVLGGVADRPLRCAEVENSLVGSRIDDGALDSALAALPLADVTMDSRLASAAYRRRLAPVLAGRALRDALERAGEAAP